MIGDGYGFFSVLIKADFLYWPTANPKSIREMKYKLIVNIDSMQEMDYPAIARYFHLKSERRRRQSLLLLQPRAKGAHRRGLSNFQSIRGGMSDTEK